MPPDKGLKDRPQRPAADTAGGTQGRGQPAVMTSKPARVCKFCGALITWRDAPGGRREPVGIDGYLHSCPRRAVRNWWAREHRRGWKALGAQRERMAERLQEQGDPTM